MKREEEREKVRKAERHRETEKGREVWSKWRRREGKTKYEGRKRNRG